MGTLWPCGILRSRDWYLVTDGQYERGSYFSLSHIAI